MHKKSPNAVLEVFISNTNLESLTFLYKIDMGGGLLKISPNIKVASSGN